MASCGQGRFIVEQLTRAFSVVALRFYESGIGTLIGT